ncbi:MAG: 2-oxoglutarate dehydrogenase E1 component [Gemmatimonadetes bacterium]|nr:2-oxoglutarate dehydrogenase E1 component [Gemmatimonadota bacterium]
MAEPVTSVFNDAYIAETYELWLRDPALVEESWRQFFLLAQRYGGGNAAWETPAPVLATRSAATTSAPRPTSPAHSIGTPGAWAHAAPAGVSPVQVAVVVPAVAQLVAASAPTSAAAAPAAIAPPPVPGHDQDFARRVVGVSRYLNSIRRFGFLAVQLDPLGTPPPGAFELTLENYGITDADLDLVTGDALGFPHLKTGRDVADRLKFRYTRNLAVEFVHCGTDEERQWFRQLFTAEQLTRPLTPDEKRDLLTRLSEVEGLERFLGRAFVGYKRFSIEGTDALVPMLDTALDESAASGARHVAISMAHRGRLNVLTHVMGKSFVHLFAEFSGRHDHLGAAATGDVKYHLGFENDHSTRSGRPLHVTLVPNPSHLEVVNPVLQGLVRAKQRHSGDPYERDEFTVVPICIHGDAAFPGEGIVAETFNLAHLRGYTVGGTLHIIVNNQVGFTTDPVDARSTRFASDLAKGFEMPVIHVNADDPEACVIAMRIAVAYRTTFGRDFLVDLVGYRRHGHNEGDEPAYTQPLLYDKIRAHPTVRQVWAQRLIREGIVSATDVGAAEREVSAELQRIYDALKDEPVVVHEEAQLEEPFQPPVTSVPLDLLHTVNDALLTWPETFTPHPRLAKQLERRRDVMDAVGGIDWGHAESLAFATILADGINVRLTGQDAERGTFSHRHSVLRDVKTGQSWTPLQHIAGTASAFEVYNSPLSETAVLGFEYGFSVTATDTLTLWEAQFGDFVNVAQPIIDQFIASDRAKWAQDSGLVLLLPHGCEGQGPEHSSARLERFLQLAAEGNMRIAYPSTPAQYFHVLRRQALMRSRRPLVLMQPKSLLRLQQAMCKVTDLSEGAFHPVIDDPDGTAKRDKVTRLVLCSGKVYYDLVATETPPDVAVVRVEELFPWPHADLTWLLDGYTALREVVWCQEEPKNQGAWTWVAPRLRATVGNVVMIRYSGRPERASPAEGYTAVHNEEQARIVADALSTAPRPMGNRRSSGVLHIV